MTYTTKQEVEEFLQKYNITKYTIRDDLTVDVAGSVNFKTINFEELPVNFGKVDSFAMNNQKLTSLKGFPKEVEMYLIINNSKITSLLGYQAKAETLEVTGNENLKSLKNELEIRINVYADNFPEFEEYYDRTEGCIAVPNQVINDYYRNEETFKKLDFSLPFKLPFKKMKV